MRVRIGGSSLIRQVPATAPRYHIVWIGSEMPRTRGRHAPFACARSVGTQCGSRRRSALTLITSITTVGGTTSAPRKRVPVGDSSCACPAPSAGTFRCRRQSSCSRAAWHPLDVPFACGSNRSTLSSSGVVIASVSTAPRDAPKHPWKRVQTQTARYAATPCWTITSL